MTSSRPPSSARGWWSSWVTPAAAPSAPHSLRSRRAVIPLPKHPLDHRPDHPAHRGSRSGRRSGCRSPGHAGERAGIGGPPAAWQPAARGAGACRRHCRHRGRVRAGDRRGALLRRRGPLGRMVSTSNQREIAFQRSLCSPGRIRTSNLLITRSPRFPSDVDYLIALARLRAVGTGRLVSEPSRGVSSGLAADCHSACAP